jgi:hypothetical protein
MRNPSIKTRRIPAGAALLAITLAMSNAACSGWRDDAIEGQVIDVATGRPVEGAYVLAQYHEFHGSWFGHSSSWCIYTKGHYTASDGKYRFPIEKGVQPRVYAIKPDYYEVVGAADIGRWEKRKEKENPKQMNLYLKPQDPFDRTWNIHVTSCDHPRTREDAAADIEFQKIKLEEYIRVEGDPQIVEDMQRSISYHEALSSESSSSRK